MQAPPPNFSSSTDASYFGPSSSTAGDSSAVASLDSPLLQQTKSEIRNLAAEIAELAHANLTPSDFFDGFLPRLTVAMGASGAAVWHLRRAGTGIGTRTGNQDASQDRAAGGASSTEATSDPVTIPPLVFNCLAEHGLARELIDDRSPTTSHGRILECVVAEGQPILVPPGNVKLETERPSNPIGDVLILVPVQVHDEIEYLLQVTKRPSGGPTAQRGYLRFVAQMADLLADFLRREQLRNISEERRRLRRIESHLIAIASAGNPSLAARRAADALADVLDGQQVLLLSGGRRPKMLAISGCKQFDPRSETVQCTQRLVAQFRWSTVTETWPRYSATDRRRVAGLEELQDAADPERAAGSVSDAGRTEDPLPPAMQAELDRLCELSGCRECQFISLGNDNSQVALALRVEVQVDGDSGDEPVGKPHANTGHDTSGHDTSTRQFVSAVSRLLVRTSATPWFGRLLRFPGPAPTPANSRRRVIERWVARAATAGLVLAIAFFPVAQHISATATLHPASQQIYYAPLAGVVTEVLVEEGEQVQAGQTLMLLTNRELESRLDQLQGELQVTQERIDEKSAKLNRGSDLKAWESDALEGELQQLRSTQSSLRQQAAIVKEQFEALVIKARSAGQVATWNLRNRWLHRPVQVGEQLVSTFVADQAWYLNIAVPDFRAGLVEEAMQAGERGATVSFSLASHPDQIRHAYLTDMASQVQQTSVGMTAGIRSIATTAAVPADVLPIKKEGAIARATIDCGIVPLCWLVFRDAYQAVGSRLRMLW